jgi:hypothetical protein
MRQSAACRSLDVPPSDVDVDKRGGALTVAANRNSNSRQCFGRDSELDCLAPMLNSNVEVSMYVCMYMHLCISEDAFVYLCARVLDFTTVC